MMPMLGVLSIFVVYNLFPVYTERYGMICCPVRSHDALSLTKWWTFR